MPDTSGRNAKTTYRPTSRRRWRMSQTMTWREISARWLRWETRNPDPWQTATGIQMNTCHRTWQGTQAPTTMGVVKHELNLIKAKRRTTVLSMDGGCKREESPDQKSHGQAIKGQSNIRLVCRYLHCYKPWLGHSIDSGKVVIVGQHARGGSPMKCYFEGMWPLFFYFPLFIFFALVLFFVSSWRQKGNVKRTFFQARVIPVISTFVIWRLSETGAF